MIKKIISSLISCCILCSVITAPLYAASPCELPNRYIISDPEDYGKQIYTHNDNGSIYQSDVEDTEDEEDKKTPDDIPVNECIIGLDDSIVKVMIDPGHYGYYNPSPVYRSYYESVMNWKLSNYLKDELEALGAHADLTKSSLDENPDLIPRGNKSKGYDFFISIHSNAASYSSIDEPVAICYQNLEWTTIDDTSREIGQLMTDKVAEVMQTKDKGITYQRLSVEDRDGNGVWDDEWYGVLCGARYVGTPGILLEHSFHTNYRATVWLSNDNNLKKMAKEEALLIFNYFTEKKAKETPVRTDPIPQEEYIPGDVDGNGKITLNDAILILEYYSQNSTGIEAKFIQNQDNAYYEELVFKAADINEDNIINIDDAIKVLLLYSGNASNE